MTHDVLINSNGKELLKGIPTLGEPEFIRCLLTNRKRSRFIDVYKTL